MKEQLLVGVPAEDTRVEKTELPLQHLQAAASPLPGGHYGATGYTCHCIHTATTRAGEKSKAESGKQISKAEGAT